MITREEGIQESNFFLERLMRRYLELRLLVILSRVKNILQQVRKDTINNDNCKKKKRKMKRDQQNSKKRSSVIDKKMIIYSLKYILYLNMWVCNEIFFWKYLL